MSSLAVRSPTACRGIAALLLVVGLSEGYWWFYKLGPTRHTFSGAWRTAHSEREYWGEVQKAIHRGMWSHDDGIAVARYGDKAWAEWIMAHVTDDEDMSCFGRLSHAADAMKHITNQDAGYNADKWLDWWAKNKSKSQLEWLASLVRDGP